MNGSNKSNYRLAGIMLPGCMFIGMGIGHLLGDIKSGLLIGMGLGFLAMGFLSIKRSKNQ